MLRSAYAVQARRKASRWPWDGPGKVTWADVISRACLSALVDGLSPVGGEKRSESFDLLLQLDHLELAPQCQPVKLLELARTPTSGYGASTSPQKIGGVLLIALVVAANLLNLSTNRLLDRTIEDVAVAGQTLGTVANVSREAGFIERAATQFPVRAQFEAATLHEALLERQLGITQAKLTGKVALEQQLSELVNRLAEVEGTLASLGTAPSKAGLISPRGPLGSQAKALEVSANNLYDASESDFLLQGRLALTVQRHCQEALIVTGIPSALITAGLLTSLGRRTSKDLSKAYHELLAESKERQIAEDVLRRSSDSFRALVHTASDVITVVDVDLRISYQSPSVTGALGRLPEDLVGTDFLELVDEADRGLAMAG